MKIKIDEAFRICEKYGRDEVPIIFLSDVYLKNSGSVLQITQGMAFDPAQAEAFRRANVKEIEVVYNERLFAKLVANFPAFYKLPVGRKNVIDLDRIIDDLESANAGTKRKRCVISLSEVYKKSMNGYFETILHYGEKLTYKRWNELKFNLNRNAGIDFRYDEGGIIVFFILSAGDPLYAQKFMKFTELVTLLVESKRSGISISPDLNPETDIYSVNDKNQLLEVYNDSKASLVIIGEDLDSDYKAALSQLKLFDRYVKLMVVKNPDPNNRVEILNKIKSVYAQKSWQE